MDKSTRNSIQRATQAARKLLEGAYREQLEGTYDILLDGTVADVPGEHLTDGQKIIREKLVAAINHKRSSGLKAKEAVNAHLREAAFTTLNRFVALKMLEARQLVQECVSKGEDSIGFKEFSALAPGLSALPDKGYRLYIETLFDEIGQEVRVLFDRRDVASLLWPDRQTLLDLLGLLNSVELAEVWAEDETIGWVYQYFNGDDERSKMRKESQAPRNSRELAVRNQFFTPRYVVQFLTDNTLGRTWYEMMQGETKLAQLDYLVRRPNEVFLAEGEEAPPADDDDSDLSQEELLNKTVHIPFRPKKDPRDLRILDPACGSGHFLLYAFDLLASIYEEAWGDKEAATFTETGTQLRADFANVDDLRCAMPGLILRHNLHGVDIDPRAAQIAALALWMRAQRAYNQFEIARDQRPAISKTNIVVAEPMPGDAELVDEFASSLKPAVLGDLFKKMVEEMKLAGELGSLLKIEASIAEAVEDAARAHQQGSLSGDKMEGKDFWDTADEKIIAALEAFAESATGSAGTRRQLFAGDAAQGVDFIDLFRRSFDLVVMNPPFGESALAVKEYTKTNYPNSAHDIFQAFVERAVELCNGRARIGCLSARTGFFMGNSESWRHNVAWKQHLEVFADFGLGVLDEALVEAAAYVLAVGETEERIPTVTTRHLSSRTKEESLAAAVSAIRGFSHADGSVFFPPLDVIRQIPNAVLAYWAPADFLRRFVSKSNFETTVAAVRQGLATADDFRFARLRWEVPEDESGPSNRWHLFSKGGEYAPPYDDIHLVVDWDNDGKVLRSRTQSRVQNDAYYHRPGVTYTVRTGSDFAAKILPAGCIFSHNAQSWFTEDKALLLASVLFFQTRAAKALIELAVGGGDVSASASAARRYTTAVIHSIPAECIPELADDVVPRCANKVLTARATSLSFDETSLLFSGLPIDEASSASDVARIETRASQKAITEALSATHQVDQAVADAMSLNASERAFIEKEAGPHPCEYPPRACKTTDIRELLKLRTDELIALAVDRRGAHRWTTKKAYQVDRRTELVCHIAQCHPTDVLAVVSQEPIHEHGLREMAETIVSYLVGIAFGRWKQTTNQECVSAFSEDPFLPLEREPALASLHDARKLFVCEEGHADDLWRGIQRACRKKDEGRGKTFLDDIEERLGVSNGANGYLREAFFGDHISRYSKSRRKAPIYWQLATSSASYSVWCYYHRLTRDTFFRIENDYVAPKLDHEERKLNELRQEAGKDPSTKQRKTIAAQESFVEELRAFKAEVARIAPLWNPNLNDGVIINFAPLWRLVPQHKPWQKECKKVWDKLVKGDYDWAHLAMHLWPERVVPKCAKDRSLAIAHGLEDDFWYEDNDGKWQKRKVGADKAQELISERASTAVKAALNDLLAAPTPGGGRKARKGRSKG